MTNTTVSNSPNSDKFHTGDLIQNSAYPLTFGVVVCSDWAANGRVFGYVVRCDAAWYRGRALQFIPADLAELLHRDEPVSVVLRENVRIAACSLPTDPNQLMSETPEQKAEREAAWSHLWDSQQAVSSITAEQNNADRAKQSARTMAEVAPLMGLENERIAAKLSGTVSKCTAGRDNTISGYLAAKRDADVEPQRREVWW